MGRKSKKQIIDELDALGAEFEETKEIIDANGETRYEEMSYDDLTKLLTEVQQTLKNGKHNGKEEPAEIKKLSDASNDEDKKETDSKLPNYLVAIPVDKKLLTELQAAKKLVGYFIKRGQEFAIIKKEYNIYEIH